MAATVATVAYLGLEACAVEVQVQLCWPGSLGPLPDRIDLHVEVLGVSAADITLAAAG